MMRRLLLCAAALALLGSGARAHHSLTAIYDSRSRVSIEGVVAEFRFINPHPLVMVEVRGPGDLAGMWQLEMDNRFELAALGMTARTLEAGDVIVATGSRARDGSPAMYVRRLERRSDGFWYEQTGSRPRVGTRSAR